MKKQKKNGFALVLSLVLLLVMSLLGGSLIVITSGDHSSNNSSDQYQQAFYVAETGLIEAEKAIINEYLGPWRDLAEVDAIQAEMTEEERTAHDEYVANNTIDGTHFRDKRGRSMPTNEIVIAETPCYKSFKNIITPPADNPDTVDIDESEFLVAIQVRNNNFGSLLTPIFAQLELNTDDDPDTAEDESRIGEASIQDEIDRETAYMGRFIYEYFVINIGSAPYRGAGASIKKTSTDTENLGTEYKVYACGMFFNAGITQPENLIPLESVLVMPN